VAADSSFIGRLAQANRDLTYPDIEKMITVSKQLLQENFNRDKEFKNETSVDDTTLDSIQLPLLNARIYIQDMAILGGFAVLILLIWLYYVRRRETGILKEIKNFVVKSKENISEDDKRMLIYTISFNSIFNNINLIDNDRSAPFPLPHRYSISPLYLLPILLMGIIWGHNLWENHISGKDFQCILEKPVHKPERFESRYFKGTVLLRMSKEIPILNVAVRKGIPTYEVVDLYFEYDREQALRLQKYVLFTEALGLLILLFIVLFHLNNKKLTGRETHYLGIIHSEIGDDILYSKKHDYSRSSE